MAPSELSRMLDIALCDLESAISLTLTSISADDDHLRKLLTTALAASRRHGVKLKEIEMPREAFRVFGRQFHTVPIRSSSDMSVLRLVFEKPARYHSLGVAA